MTDNSKSNVWKQCFEKLFSKRSIDHEKVSWNLILPNTKLPIGSSKGLSYLI